MKRVLCSIVGGIFIPSVYMGIVLMISYIVTLAAPTASVDSTWYWVLRFPLEWSGHLYNHFFPPETEQAFDELRTQVFLTNVISKLSCR
jgi:hypothetical protein